PPRHRLSGGGTGIAGKIESLGVARRRAARLCCLRATILASRMSRGCVAAGTLNQFERLRTRTSMADLADLYPGFASHCIDTRAGRIFARRGAEGPPLVLLHGYPQTNVMWHRVAPALAAQFSLIIPDLPGYGWSDAPSSAAAHAPYAKRAMAAAMIEVMEALGHVRFRLAGHDRGGRGPPRHPAPR